MMAAKSMQLKALDVAKTQLGAVENPIGSNWGHPVKDYLASVGLNFPASWCMAFVYWCYNQSCTPNPLVRTGGVLRAWNEADPKHKFKDPKVGDIFIMDFGKGLGHCGIVEKIDENFVYTIDGNTNDSGSREGIEVTRKQRPRKKIKGYLRYV